MDAQVLLQELRGRGVELHPAGESIRVVARAPISPDTRDIIRARKSDLLAVLAQVPTPTTPDNTPATRASRSEAHRRAVLFRQQIDAWAASGRIGIPVVTLPDAPDPRDSACVSCGGDLDGNNWRCPTCVSALRVALG